MNRTKKFFYNSTTTAALQIITMLVGLITPKIMLDTYGSEINGLVSSIAQFIAYFNLVEAGLSGAAVYALYKPLAEKDHKAINGVVSATKIFYTQAGYIFVVLTVGLSVVYPLYIKSDVISSLEIGLLVLVLGINGAMEFFTLSKYRAILTASQKTYVISLASIVYVLVNATLIIVLASFSVNIVLLRLICALSIFLRSIILLTYCKKQYKYLNYRETPNKAALNKRWDALYLQILGTIHTGAPVVIITLVIKDLMIVSVYTIFNMVIAGINSILSIFISGLSAAFGDLIIKGERERLQGAYKEFEFMYYALISTVYSIAFVTIMSFVNIYTKNVEDINYNMPIVGFLFVLNGLLYNIKTPQGMLVISAGMYKETKRQTTIQGAIAVIVGVALAPIFGIAGVLLGSICSNIYRDIDLLFFIPKNVTKTKVWGTFVRIIRIFICVGVSNLPFFFISYTPTTLIMWAVYAAAVSIYVVLVVLVINCLFDRQEFVNVLKRVRVLVGR